MAIAEVATSAVTLLAPYLVKAAEGAAQEVGKNTWEKVKGIYQAIHQKFQHDKDEYAQQTLRRLEEKPEERGRQSALQGLLEEKLEADSNFKTQLNKLIYETTEGQPASQFVTQVFGQAKVGRVVNIGTANGDVNV